MMTEVGAAYVVVGGGAAAAAAVRVLCESDEASRINLITAEQEAPYDRTTLSKQILADSDYEAPRLFPSNESWLERLDLTVGHEVVEIDLADCNVRLDDERSVPFDRLLVATGAKPRRLALPGASGSGVHYLRDLVDARRLAVELQPGRSIAVVGAGVLGLEVAAAARTVGCDVTVIEAGSRILGRSVPAEVADRIGEIHRDHGVSLTTSVAPVEVLRSVGLVCGLALSDGSMIAADVVVVAIGIIPCDELAQRAGLDVDDGILVDEHMRTSDSSVFAAGDAVRLRTPGSMPGVRLESYQVAGRQGEVAARNMMGGHPEYRDVPWTWSDQYGHSMQSAGSAHGTASECYELDGSVLVLTFRASLLVGAAGVAQGGAIARPVRAALRLIEAGGQVDHSMLREAPDLLALTALLKAAATELDFGSASSVGEG